MGKGKRITEEEIQQMVRMRHEGYSMEAIGERLGRHRHTVRMYLEETQARSLADQARKEVLIQELQRHLDELSQFGVSLVEHLTVPDSPYETRDSVALLYPLRSGQNKVLFESFQEHTQGISWQAFEEWERAWDNCIWALGELRRVATEELEWLSKELITGKNVEEPIKDAVETNLIDVLMASTGKDRDIAIKRVTDGIVHLLWRHILQPDEEFPLVETMPRAYRRVEIVFGTERFTSYLIVREQSQADKIMGICKSAAEKLRGDMTGAVAKQIDTMRVSIEEFREVLSPLRLRPILLRNRCSLCPA